MSSLRTILRFVAIWLGCVAALDLLFFGAFFGLAGEWRYVQLARSWGVSTGTVVAVDRGNHLGITVRYSVNGREIQQAFGGSYKNVGDTAEVYYLAKDPTMADIRNPREWLKNTLRVFLLGNLVLGAFVALMIHFPAVGQALSWPWSGFRIRPRFALTWIAIAVLIGSIGPFFSGTLGGRLLLADAFVLGGPGLLCRRAFQLPYETSWCVFAKSTAVLVAVFLIVSGQLVNLLSAK